MAVFYAPGARTVENYRRKSFQKMEITMEL